MLIDANSKGHNEVDEEEEEAQYQASLENRCCICLEQITDKTKPEECRHIFCQACIVAWTRFSNVCPLCKVEIQWLQIFNAENEVTEKVKIEKPEQNNENSDWV
jgi:hypothetical protein